MRFALVAALSYFSCAEAYDVAQLTVENYDELTDGKTVFLKFFAPWVSGPLSSLSLLVIRRRIARSLPFVARQSSLFL
jgi:hypothetical protein